MIGFPDLLFPLEPIMGWKEEDRTRDQGLPSVTDKTALCQDPTLLRQGQRSCPQDPS